MSSPPKHEQGGIRRLRWELSAACFIGLAALACAGWAWGSRSWLVGASSYFVYVSYWCVSHIELHRGSKSLHPRLGLGFWVTWIRALALAFIAGGICDADMLTASGHLFCVVYGLVVLGDGVDGLSARWSQTVSEMGARFDNHVDGFGMFFASVAAVTSGALPVYYLLLSLAYFGFHFGLWWRQRRGMVVFRGRIMLSLHNRYFAGVHMCLLVVALTPGSDASTLAIVATIGECLLLACFLRDWLLVSGALIPGQGRFSQAWNHAVSGAVVQGSLIARACMGLALVAGVLDGLPVWVLMVSVTVVAGFFARTLAWAVLVVFSLGVVPLASEVVFVVVPLFTWIAWLGSGPYSLSRFDDAVYLGTTSRAAS